MWKLTDNVVSSTQFSLAMIVKSVAVIILLCTLSVDISNAAKLLLQPGLPSRLCANDMYRCDKTAWKRWILFNNAEGIPSSESRILRVGKCSLNGNSDSQTYVLMALSPKGSNLYFDSKISFFDDLSEYQDENDVNIQQIFPDIFMERNMLSVSDKYAYVDYSQSAPFRYWIRYHDEYNKFILASYFGFLKTFICEFDA